MDKFFHSPKRIIITFCVCVIFIILVIIGSNTRPSTQNITVVLPPWLSDWINTPICNPPCWENLTPGQDLFIKANKVITSRPDTELILEETGPLSKEQKVLYWHFSSSSGNGEIYSDLRGEVISAVILHPKNTFGIEKIITQFGAPEKITISSCYSEDQLICEVRLLYPEIGLAVKFRAVQTYENSDEQNFSIEVLSENKVTEIMLFPPGDEGYIQATTNKVFDDLERAQKWQGFGKYTIPVK